MSEPRIGEVVGGYRLTRELATGGMGVVFEARHASLDREAVVKVLAPKLAADEDFVSRFKHEARIASDLDHPCIVDVFDLVDVDQPRRVACVMERLEGPTLAKLLLKGPLRYEQALNVTLQIVDAIGCVHEAGVIHRDLKPQNIVVVGPLHTDLMAVPSVKILDFGIAKIT
ncbi:MAG: serine/threonine-protein kinase, partial [Deltaproteobacteria bacterium]